MIYGTGGFAYGDVFNKDTLYAPNSSTVRFFGSSDKTQTGYAAGGGIEYALPTGSFLNFFKSSAVTIKAEYLYYDLGSTTVLATPVVSGSTGGYSSRYKVARPVSGGLLRRRRATALPKMQRWYASLPGAG